MKGLLALVLFVVIGFITYPGADAVSLTVWLSHPPSVINPAVQGSLAWLHVEHPPGKTPFISDDQKRALTDEGIRPHRRFAGRGWIETDVESGQDVARVLRWLRRAYVSAQRTADDEA